ncbi:unnamed protein product [Orchesella dallaii]|uniref:S-phase kinase-associated protein 1 n=1 Tax=Orchesella dallaii TaxID=48710 RepID=A0ABP1RCE6_9HEXA
MPKIKLISNDKQEFIVDTNVVIVSTTIANMLGSLGVEDREEGDLEEVPLANVKGSTLKKILEWAEHDMVSEPNMNGARARGRDKISEWEATFMDGWDIITLIDVISAANYLDMKPFFDVTSLKAANMLAGKTAEEMREIMKFKQQNFEPIQIDPGNGNTPHVILKSSDHQLYIVDRGVVEVIPKLKSIMEEMKVKDGEQVPFILDYSSSVEKVIEWAKYQKNKQSESSGNENDIDLDNLPEFEKEFLESLSDPGDLFEVLSLARKLEMRDLKQLLSKKIVSMIVGKTDDEIRKAFKVKNDFTEEELEWIRKENSWIQ